MTHTPHELADDFPDKVDVIHELKMNDGEFRALANKYHELNRAIHRAETNIEPCAPRHEEEMRRTRVQLKDRISAKLTQTAKKPLTGGT